MGCELYLDLRRYKVPREWASRRDGTVTSDGAGSGNGTPDDTTSGSGNGRDVATGITMERTLTALFIAMLIIVSIPGRGWGARIRNWGKVMFSHACVILQTKGGGGGGGQRPLWGETLRSSSTLAHLPQWPVYMLLECIFVACVADLFPRFMDFRSLIE